MSSLTPRDMLPIAVSLIVVIVGILLLPSVIVNENTLTTIRTAVVVVGFIFIYGQIRRTLLRLGTLSDGKMFVVMLVYIVVYLSIVIVLIRLSQAA